MKDWKLWKIILLLFGTYFGLNVVFTLVLFAVTGNIGDLFGSSDSFMLWINYIFYPSVAAPGIKLIVTGQEASVSPLNATLFNLLLFLPGIISAILVGLFSKNSKVAFRVTFLFYIVLLIINTILFFALDSSQYPYSLGLITSYIITLPPPVQIQWVIFSGLIHSVFHGGIAGQIRNLMRRKQDR